MEINEANSTTQEVVIEVSTSEEANNMEVVDTAIPETNTAVDNPSTIEPLMETTNMEEVVPEPEVKDTPSSEPKSEATKIVEVVLADVPETKFEINSSLSLISQYDSSSGGSSDSEDSSDESSSSSSSSSEDEVVEAVPLPLKTYRNTDVKIEVSSESENEALMSDDDNENVGHNGKFIPKPIKVEGELLVSDLPPIEELHITVPEQECVQLGIIHSIVEQIVLVNSLPGTVPLNIDTVLFLDKGTKTLGKIFDVIGQVSDPLYCVLFNSRAEITSKGVEVGIPVYCAPKTEHTSFIILSDLMRTRGSDASWKNDCEPPDRYLDYSDDEQERSARKNRVGYRNESEVITVEDDSARPKHYRHTTHHAGGQQQRRPFRRNRGQNYRHNNPNPHVQHPPNYSWHHNFTQQSYNQPPPLINPFAAPPTNLFLNPFAMPPPPPPPHHHQ